MKVFSSPISATVHNLKNVLEARGIACEILGENLMGVAGELPPVECWAELWVVDKSRAEEAKQLIAETAQAGGAAWTCRNCSEIVDGEFGQCWNCQEDRPS